MFHDLRISIQKILLLFAVSMPALAFGQDNNDQTFFEIISDDSVRLFCSERYLFTSVNCPYFIRYSKMTADGKFDGTFIDVQGDSAILARGAYRDGLKQGYFEIFYPNGNLKSKGSYDTNVPIDDWFFFRENGLPERWLQISGNDTLVVQQADEKGESTVVGGNGIFDGLVEPRLNFKGLWAKGEIKNGKRDGKWVTYFPKSKFKGKITYATEEYNNGKLVSGEYPTPANKHKKYSDSPIFRFLLTPQIVNLEKFQFYKCQILSTEFPRMKKPEVFYRVISSVLYSPSFQYMGNLSAPIKIRFQVTTEGLPINFQVQNKLYPEMTARLIYALRQYVRFIPASRNNRAFEQTIYFNVRYIGGGKKYMFSISPN